MNFIDLAAQQVRIRRQLEQRIKAVLDHGQYIMGPEVRELEKHLATFTGAKHCISCSSGTDALLMALMAWDIGPGDAVFVPAYTFFATVEVVALLGAVPVLVDIDPATFNMNPSDLAKAVEAVLRQDATLYPLPTPALHSKLTPKAVIPVDLFGQSANYDALLPVAKHYELLMLEDAAQSFGACHRAKRTCNLGCDMASTSFFPAKPLGCYGDGGAVFTNNDEWAERLRSIRVHGKGSDKYDNIRIGLTARLDTLQATILLAKLDIFESELAARNNVAEWYTEKLANIPWLVLPCVASENTSVWAQFCIRIMEGRREAVAATMKERDIPTNIYYPKPINMLKAFQNLGYNPEDMPQSLTASQEALALPFHPYMTESNVETVVSVIMECSHAR